jgi:hypothetical protein
MLKTHRFIPIAMSCLLCFFAACFHKSENLSSLEATAYGRMIYFTQSQESYAQTHGRYATLEELRNFVGESFIQPELGLYHFEVEVTEPERKHFRIWGTPIKYNDQPNTLFGASAHNGMTRFSFYIDDRLILKGANLKGQKANSDAPILKSL